MFERPNWNTETIVKFKKLTKGAKTPYKATKGSSGWDIYPSYRGMLLKGTQLIDTGIAVELESGFEIQIRSRSGWAADGVEVHQGTIDSDYRGEIKILVHNFGGKEFVLDPDRTRIAQLVVHKVPTVSWVEVDKLSDTERGTRGFGNTGGRSI